MWDSGYKPPPSAQQLTFSCAAVIAFTASWGSLMGSSPEAFQYRRSVACATWPIWVQQGVCSCACLLWHGLRHAAGRPGRVLNGMIVQLSPQHLVDHCLLAPVKIRKKAGRHLGVEVLPAVSRLPILGQALHSTHVT